MTTVLGRYLAGAVVKGSLLALLVLTALGALFGYMEELGDLQGRYGALDALIYVGLALPRLAYELFPTAVLLGSLLALGGMASHSELVAMRASGFSISRVGLAVLQGGLVLLLLAVFLGEIVAPSSEKYARERRAALQTGHIALQGDFGFWARHGHAFFNVERVLPEGRLRGVRIYEYGDGHRLRKVTAVETAEYRQGHWVLHQVRESEIEPQRIRTQSQTTAERETLVNPELLDVLTLEPVNLSARALLRYIEYLAANRLNTQRYELAFWVKVFNPVSGLAMVLLALPFVFGPLRSTSAGQRIFFGVLIGLVFYLLNQALNYVGIVYGMPPILAAALPSLIAFTAGLIALHRIR